MLEYLTDKTLRTKTSATCWHREIKHGMLLANHSPRSESNYQWNLQPLLALSRCGQRAVAVDGSQYLIEPNTQLTPLTDVRLRPADYLSR
jgi:hypothetical protein